MTKINGDPVTGQLSKLERCAGAMVIAAAGSSTISGLDREFPLLQQGGRSQGLSQGMQDKPRPRTPVLEILFVALIILLAAVFSYKFGRYDTF